MEAVRFACGRRHGGSAGLDLRQRRHSGGLPVTVSAQGLPARAFRRAACYIIIPGLACPSHLVICSSYRPCNVTCYVMCYC